MNMKLIDIERWERAEVFEHFIRRVRCVMSATVEMDVTHFYEYVKEKRKLKFFPAMLCALSYVVNHQEEMKLGLDETGRVGRYDWISPSYPVFFFNYMSLT